MGTYIYAYTSRFSIFSTPWICILNRSVLLYFANITFNKHGASI